MNLSKGFEAAASQGQISVHRDVDAAIKAADDRKPARSTSNRRLKPAPSG